jgi:hypothetical protein
MLEVVALMVVVGMVMVMMVMAAGVTRAQERAGHIRAEKRLAAIARASPSPVATPPQMGWAVMWRLIGTLRSVFRTRNGTLRRAGLVASARAMFELDLVDGTPVLDIRPYIPHSNSVPEGAARVAL